MQLTRRLGADALADALESWTWLDVLAGMSPVLATAAEDEYLMAGLALEAEELGFVPGDGQVLSFKVPTSLAVPCRWRTSKSRTSS